MILKEYVNEELCKKLFVEAYDLAKKEESKTKWKDEAMNASILNRVKDLCIESGADSKSNFQQALLLLKAMKQTVDVLRIKDLIQKELATNN